MKSKTSLVLPVCVAILTLGGCSTTQSRASRHPDFATWTPAVQQAVLAGKIDIGFTAEQVQVALGEPDYSYTRTTADGTTEVWGFRDHKPRFGFGVGIGMGSMHGGTAVGTGVSVGTGVGQADEKVRVIFDRMGRVASVEETTRRG